MPERDDGPAWRLCRSTGPLTRALCSCLALAALGAYAGGLLGLAAAVLFAAGAVTVAVKRFRSRPLAELSGTGVVLAGRRGGGGRSVSWANVGAFVLWTRDRGSVRHDVLTVLTQAELPILTDASLLGRSGSSPTAVSIKESAMVDLSGCVIDAAELRVAIGRFDASAPVIDRRR